MNPPIAHAELIATFKRAEADAAHKFGLIKAAASKAPRPSKPLPKQQQRPQNAGTLLQKKAGRSGGRTKVLSAANQWRNTRHWRPRITGPDHPNNLRHLKTYSIMDPAPICMLSKYGS